MTAPTPAPQVALADAQFGISAILRPFQNFETVYQGQDSQTPIMVSQVLNTAGGTAQDTLSANNVAGYDRFLLRGLAVPFGSLVLIQLPKMGLVANSTRYNWIIAWRLRCVRDFRLDRSYPYHLGKGGAGVPDTSPAPVGGTRIVLPCADETIIFNEAEPAGAGDIAINNARTEAISVNPEATPPLPLPFLPSGAHGVYQQGIQNPATVTQAIAGRPGYMTRTVRAKGDELLLGFYRTPGAAPLWNFLPGQVDENVSQILGGGSTPNVGVYVLTGTAP